MTSLEIYLIVAPLVLAGLGWAVYWWIVRNDRQNPRTR
jgi:cbb3-type cytochrome oxidase maturation protein